ncbi:MAG TPA: peptidoglycan-binding domain-containing protein [Pedococcus sp.]|jgi:peptidoglycan hydrolase-like protein with peptidoglycan-binding domain
MIAWETGALDGAETTARPGLAFDDYHWLAPGARTLRPLDAGDDVKYLQARLGVRADGYFGPRTAQALVAFLEDRGLEAEPVVGRAVWALLIDRPAVQARRRRWPVALRVAR